MKHKLLFLLLSFLASVSMMGIGISIAYRTMTGVILSIVGLIIVMGIGFSTKKKFRLEGKI